MLIGGHLRRRSSRRSASTVPSRSAPTPSSSSRSPTAPGAFPTTTRRSHGVSRETRGERDRRRVHPRPLPPQPREPENPDFYEKSIDGASPDRRDGERDRRRGRLLPHRLAPGRRASRVARSHRGRRSSRRSRLLRSNLASDREHRRRRRHDRPLGRRARDDRRSVDKHPRLGLCLDSCHLYASGYDITDREELDRRWMRWMSASASTACAACTSTTPRRRWGRTATGTTACSPG